MPNEPSDKSSNELINRNIKVTAMTYPSDEYDTEPEMVTGILFTRPSPFGIHPQCWVNGIQVDPSTIEPITEEDNENEDVDEGDYEEDIDEEDEDE